MLSHHNSLTNGEVQTIQVTDAMIMAMIHLLPLTTCHPLPDQHNVKWYGGYTKTTQHLPNATLIVSDTSKYFQHG